MVSVICYFLGFLLQLLPCSFYCLYPFWDSFRFPRKKVVSTVLFFLIILDVLFVWLGLFPPASLKEEASLFCESVFYLSLLLLLGCYLFCIQGNRLYKLFTFFVVMNFGFFLTETVSLLCVLYDTIHILPNVYNRIYTPRGLVFHILLNLILFYPMLQLMKYIKRIFQTPVPKELWKKFTLIPGGFMLFLGLFYRLPLMSHISNGIILELFTKSIEIFMLILYYQIFQILEQVQKKAEESSRMKAMVENYKNIALATEQLHEMRHEFNHHIQALSILMEQKNYTGVHEYLGRLGHFMDTIPSLSYTPHPLVNSILAQYRQKAESKGIHIRYHIILPHSPAIEDMDLCQLLTNLLDNALEASCHVEKEKRMISFTMKQNGNFLLFSCENTCDSSRIILQNGQLHSIKTSDGEIHGFGIPIMKRIADKYNGALTAYVSENHFKTTVNLCLTDHGRQRKEQ